MFKILKILLPALVIVLLISIIYIQKSDYRLIEDELFRQKHNQALLENNNVLAWKTDNAILSDSIISDENSNILERSKLLEKAPILVFRFSQLDCATCVLKQTSLIDDYIKINNINTILVSDYSNVRNLALFKRINGIKSDIYNCKKLLSTEASSPYYFIITKDWEIRNIYFPDDDYPELTKQYFEVVTEKYFTKIPN